MNSTAHKHGLMGDSVLLVFGATGGFGSEVCAQLAAQGATVIATGRNPKALDQLAGRLGVGSVLLEGHEGQFEKCVEHCLTVHGRIDGVANCIGSLLLKPAHLTSNDEWEETILANLTSAFQTVQVAAKAMTSTGGSIVLVSSAAARVGMANHEAIAAAKAGVIGLTLSAAATYASRQIRVNCVAPGLVRTPLTDRLTQNEASLKISTAMQPLGRIGEPADVAQAITWLLSPSQSWLTGQVIGVDGGLASLKARVAA